MIDTLPLDLFGDEEPDDAPAPETAVVAACPWCAADVTREATTCPACGARLAPVEPPAAPSQDGICQWCGATIAPDVDVCPACGWDARGDNKVEMPGITTPLSESEVRALYGGDQEPDPDPTDAIALVADVITLLLPRD